MPNKYDVFLLLGMKTRIIIHMDMDAFMEILHLYTSTVEIVGIDEAYMDITEEAEAYGCAFKLGQHLRRAVFEATQLTCSVGIGSNKLIAKIASSFAKPNGLYEIPAGNELAFLAPLPIGSLPGIGTKTQFILNQEGFKTVKDLQAWGHDALIKKFGAHGYHFYMASIGKDNRPVDSSESSPKSIGAESTFESDQTDRAILVEKLIEMFQKAYKRLRRYRMRARGISLKLRYSDFKTITRVCTFDSHSNDDDFLLKHLISLFDKFYSEDFPIRLIGVSLEKLTDLYWQPTLWDWQREKENKGH
jgi:DNA polymerase-4